MRGSGRGRSPDRATNSETWLDRAIKWMSPRWGLQRVRARMASSVLMTYEGARTDRRASGWWTADSSANAEIGPALAKLRQRSRDLVRNNAYAARALNELAGLAVGTGITAQARPAGSDAQLAKQINDAWKAFVDECDADGQLDFNRLQRLAVRTVVESGECLVRFRPRYADDGFRVPMQIQVLDPDYLDTSLTQETKTGRIVQGWRLAMIADRRIRTQCYWV